MNPVEVRYGTVELPSYEVGPPDPEPPLLSAMAPRGQSVYPYPTLERFAAEATPRTLKTVVLENDSLRLTFLPELNARLWSLYDKLAGREVLYANPELKPGLVGLRGVWYATGIEVNFPSSHTVTTADEVPWRVDVDEDGSWASFTAYNVDASSGMTWCCVTSLLAGDASVKMSTRLLNPTELPHRWYYWTNAAVPIHPSTRYLFPPSTRHILTHPPLGGHSLGLIDYPEHDGVDMSRFHNLRRHSSLFAASMDEGWFGVYHDELDTGLAHVADPHQAPGRKIWSWGFAPDGQVWHDRLTDSGGPYLEMQCGPLRHQNEFRMFPPGGQLVVSESWLPLRGLGGLSWTDGDVAVHWQEEGDALRLRIVARFAMPEATVALVSDPARVPTESGFEDERAERYHLVGDTAVTADLGPEPVELVLPLPAGATELRILGAEQYFPIIAPLHREPRRPQRSPQTSDGTPTQRAREHELHGRPDKALPLYRAGADTDAEAATALARFALARDDGDEAWRWARRALALDRRHAWAWCVAGLAARRRGEGDAAVECFEEALGYAETRTAAERALVDERLRVGAFLEVERWMVDVGSDEVGLGDGRLAHVFRRQGGSLWDGSETPAAAEHVNHPLQWAEWRLSGEGDPPPLTAAAKLAAVELLLRFGDPDGALRLLDDETAPAPGTPLILLDYVRAFITGDLPPLDKLWTPEEGFAHGPFAIRVLRWAVESIDDVVAHFHLGCALAAAGDWATAETHWAAATGGPLAAMAWRNLGLSAWKQHGDLAAAESAYRQAVEHGPGARTLLELDQVLAEQGKHPARVELLRAEADHHEGDTRVILRLAAAHADAGQPAEALGILERTRFDLHEGGALPQVLWRRAHVALARAAEDPGDSAEHYREAARYPAHLGVGAPAENREAELWFRAGEAHAADDDAGSAREAWARGAEPGDVLAVRPLPGESARIPGSWVRNLVYRALCLRRLGETARAEALLDEAAALAAGCDDGALTTAIAAAREGRDAA